MAKPTARVARPRKPPAGRPWLHGAIITAGTVYVAPPDKHMVLADGSIVRSSAPKEHFTRPAADPLFRSAAVNYGDRAVGLYSPESRMTAHEGHRAGQRYSASRT
ncbi:chemotaxis protein CheB [Paraburkholderia strydomiana]